VIEIGERKVEFALLPADDPAIDECVYQVRIEAQRSIQLGERFCRAFPSIGKPCRAQDAPRQGR
jgi:hypothetical protein